MQSGEHISRSESFYYDASYCVHLKSYLIFVFKSTVLGESHLRNVILKIDIEQVRVEKYHWIISHSKPQKIVWKVTLTLLQQCEILSITISISLHYYDSSVLYFYRSIDIAKISLYLTYDKVHTYREYAWIYHHSPQPSRLFRNFRSSGRRLSTCEGDARQSGTTSKRKCKFWDNDEYLEDSTEPYLERRFGKVA